ncbi:hypothetical protein [Cardinium endosymbiont of Sogatella furcifera]|nr:hypothetical protein [Cardinium endosymbiont of Sogatella furcifera]
MMRTIAQKYKEEGRQFGQKRDKLEGKLAIASCLSEGESLESV